MRTVAVLPVKRFGAAKQRLGDELSPGSRRALTEAMVTDVLIALRRAKSVDAVVVVTGESSATALALGHGADAIPDPDDAGHVEAAERGVRWAVSNGADRVLLVPGDTPALDPKELDALLARTRSTARAGGHHRPRPPRDRHERAGPDAAPGHRAVVRPREPRAPRAAGRGRRRRRPRGGGPHAGARRRQPRRPRRAAGRARRPDGRRVAHARHARPPRPAVTELRARALPGMPEVRPGDDLAALLAAARGGAFAPGEVLVVAHKVVSKAEGALRRLADVEVSPRARARRGPRRQGPAPGPGRARRDGGGRPGRARGPHQPHPPRVRVRQRGGRRLEHGRGRRRADAAAGPRRLGAGAARRPARASRRRRHGLLRPRVAPRPVRRRHRPGRARGARGLARAPRRRRPCAAGDLDRRRRPGRGRRGPRPPKDGRVPAAVLTASRPTSPTTTVPARRRSCARAPRTSSASRPRRPRPVDHRGFPLYGARAWVAGPRRPEVVAARAYRTPARRNLHMRKVLAAAMLACGMLGVAAAADGASDGTRQYVVLYEEGASATAAQAAIEDAGGKIVDENTAIGVATVRTSDASFASDVARCEGDRRRGDRQRDRQGTQRRGQGAPRRRSRSRPWPTPAAQGRRRPRGRRGRRPAEPPAVGHAAHRRHAGRAPTPASRARTRSRSASSTPASTGATRTSRRTSTRGLSRNFTVDDPTIDGPCADEPDRLLPGCGRTSTRTGTARTWRPRSARRSTARASPASRRASTSSTSAPGRTRGTSSSGRPLDALTYAGDHGVDVVNMSFYIDPWLYNCTANPADSPAEQREQRLVIEATQRAIDYARARGVTTIAAEGNGHTDLGQADVRRQLARTTRSTPTATRPRAPAHDRQLVHLGADGGRRRHRRHLGRAERPQGVLLRLRHRAGRRRRARRRRATTRRPAWPARRTSSWPPTPSRWAGSRTATGTARRTSTPTAPRPRPPSCSRRAYYQWIQGTSMASPHAVGRRRPDRRGVRPEGPPPRWADAVAPTAVRAQAAQLGHRPRLPDPRTQDVHRADEPGAVHGDLRGRRRRQRVLRRRHRQRARRGDGPPLGRGPPDDRRRGPPPAGRGASAAG